MFMLIGANIKLYLSLGEVQSGIYYGKGTRLSENKNSLINGNLSPNSSFALLFLRTSSKANACSIGRCLKKLWKLYKDLEKGVIMDAPNCRVPSASLSVLIAYGPKVFELPAVKKQIPLDMKYKQFLPARSNKPILKGS